ncbi:MAG: hypothetical protein JNL96_25005 [Planctomycetaceae bacterium]|nr:hypothetical protein [Planctomycetaceae bacterium]
MMRPISISLFIVVAAAIVAITVPAMWTFVQTPREASIMVEIDQLQTAFHTYKEKRTEYPPCLCETDAERRKLRFMRHLSAAYTKSDYGTTAEDYDKLRSALMSDDPNDHTKQPYNFRDAEGNLQPLDLDTLDPAEAMVFWLGGFPTPYNVQTKTPVSNRRLLGFHRDLDTPLKREDFFLEGSNPMRFRTDLLYQFDDTRFVDNDHDGWLEYVPIAQRQGEVDASFVYFDSACYQASTGDEALVGTVFYRRDAELAAKIGQISPFAETFDPARPQATKWHKPESFQIVCGGQDHLFGPPAGEAAGARRIALWPAGITYESPNGQNFSPRELADEEEDNLSNLDNVPLGTAMKRAK